MVDSCTYKYIYKYFISKYVLDGTFPKRRTMRMARRMRTVPADSLVAAMEKSDRPTTAASRRDLAQRACVAILICVAVVIRAK